MINRDENLIKDYLYKKRLNPRKQGNDFVIEHCPFCNDGKWHFYIKRSDGCFHCFRCNAKGSFYDLQKKLGDKPMFLNKKSLKSLILKEVDGYHRRLPPEIRRWLNKRQISDKTINKHKLGWVCKGTNWLTIPISDKSGELVYFKYRRSPKDKREPKYKYPTGAKAELYGWENLRNPKIKRIIICEGEFDRLLLEDKGISAITSTGGATTFKKEWARDFNRVPKVYICFDNDAAGRRGAREVARLISHSKIISLPKEVGDGGDITDFFVKLGKSVDDFKELLKEARPFQKRFIKCFIEKENNELIGILGESLYATLRAIAGFMDENGKAKIGEDRLAEILKRSQQTISKRIRELKKIKYKGRKVLTVSQKKAAGSKWGHNIYTIDPVAGFQYGNNPDYTVSKN